jgi:hypothetical protein
MPGEDPDLAGIIAGPQPIEKKPEAPTGTERPADGEETTRAGKEASSDDRRPNPGDRS